MANTRNANTFYIDTAYTGAADELAIKNIRVLHITLTATSANAILVLKDSVTGNTKIEVRLATSGDTRSISFAEGVSMVFPTGIRPTTVTNGTACLIIDESRG